MLNLSKILFVVAGIVCLATFNTYSQISPGDLTLAHAKFEGISNCTKCHELGKKLTNQKCLNCHTEIKNLIDKNLGFHSSSDVKGNVCWKCHSEHNGRKFRIVNFDPDKFDHSKTTFQLTGKHAEIKCKDCHKNKFISNPKLRRKNTFIGLSTNCVSCHEDVHQKTLGNDCASCHTTVQFKKAEKFDHSKTKFVLTGAHETVDCIKCHVKGKKNGKDFQNFKVVQFANCTPCHQDIHKGKFGADCKSCHVTSSFKTIKRGSFDHDKTKFPLLGKHKTVSCNKCHKQGITKKIKFQKCIDCHEDYHKGQFTNNNVITDCSSCHNVQGFSPSTFTLELHNKSVFKLTGAHLAVPCKSCHLKGKDLLFTTLSGKCIDCHKNVHGNEIKTEFMADDNCQSCHSTEDWETIKFDHDKTKFALLGKHKSVTCGKCHMEKDANKIVFKFASLNSDCQTCHKDVHFGQFDKNGKTDCSQCHNSENWNPVKFDHEKTQFSLKGAHQNLACSKCHSQVIEGSNRFIQFKLKDFKCASCHSS